jgi:short-subunit dehydrogenase
MWLTPQQVVDQALRDAKRNKAISVAGLQYKTLGLFVRTAPRWIIRQMSPR